MRRSLAPFFCGALTCNPTPEPPQPLARPSSASQSSGPQSSPPQSSPPQSSPPQSAAPVALSGAASAPLPATPGLTIDKVVARLAKSRGLWSNGTFPVLAAPASATTREVLQEMFQRASFERGAVKTFEILEEREVPELGTPPYRAARVRTDQGDRVVLLRFRSSWWTRVYTEAP